MNDIPNDETLDSLLGTDPLLEAEKLTGKSYKEDEETSALGMMFHMGLNHQKQEALKQCDDTYWSCPFTDFIRIAKGEGFKIIYQDKIPRFDFRTGELEFENTLYLMWYKGLLLVVSSYWADDRVVNQADIYFNWQWSEHYTNVFCEAQRRSYEYDKLHGYVSYAEKPKFYAGLDDFYQKIAVISERSSGCLETGEPDVRKPAKPPIYYCYSRDVREGFRYVLSRLLLIDSTYGSFLERWHKLPSRFLLGPGCFAQPREKECYVSSSKLFARYVSEHLSMEFDWLSTLLRQAFSKEE